MLKFNILLVFSFLLFFLSCNKRQPKEFDKKIIELISEEDSKYPSVLSPVLFFGKCKDNKIAILHVQELKAIHKMKYNNLEFRFFLEQALNQKIDLNYNDKIPCFTINPDVAILYKKEHFDDFIKIFCDKIETHTIRLKSSIPDNQITSVLYFFFLNNYLSYFDDNIGRYYVKSTSSIN
jgi:hypothetical protein